MKEKKIFTVTDLGGGDGGKGGVVHKVCVFKDAHTVLKVGGAQGSHGVRTSRGESFNFSQFGCGTFEGVRTHITNLMTVDPIGILAEGNKLRFEHGVPNAFDLLTLDEDCLCTTPFHGIASRLRELARKEAQKGTVGVGVGEAKLDAELHPELALYIRDLSSGDLRERVEAVRQQKLAELAPIIGAVDSLWSADQALAKKDIDLLQDSRFAVWVAEQLTKASREVRIVDTSHLEREVLARDGVVVVESSHGVLTDRYYGFHPYVSRLRTLPESIYRLLRERGYGGDIVRLGVTRAYQIRHGAGPMVTESPEMLDRLLPGSSKNENRWQGRVRVGPLDFVALRYSIGVCGHDAFDGIAVTWFDQIQEVGEWKICSSYEGANDKEFFSPTGDIIVRRGEDSVQVARQQELGKRLQQCRPHVESFQLPNRSDQEHVCGLVSDIFNDRLGLPVRMISFGPTEDDKVCL